MNRTALLLGATGLVGSKLLPLLLQDTGYAHVRILVRKPIAQTHSKLEQITVDFDRLNEHAAAFTVDDVFCCLGTTIKKAGSQAAFYQVDATYPIEAARLAKQAEVKQFLLITAMGADAKSRIFYNRVKGEAEDRIAALQLPAFHIFRPSLLLGERNENRIGEKIAQAVMPALDFLLIGPLKKYRAIRADTVARAMLRVAK